MLSSHLLQSTHPLPGTSTARRTWYSGAGKGQRYRASLAHKQQYHALCPTMMSHNEDSRCGAVPLETRQVGGELDPMPQRARGPTTATGQWSLCFTEQMRAMEGAQFRQLPETTSGYHPQALRTNSTVHWGIFGQWLHSSERLGWTSELGRTTKKKKRTTQGRTQCLQHLP